MSSKVHPCLLFGRTPRFPFGPTIGAILRFGETRLSRSRVNGKRHARILAAAATREIAEMSIARRQVITRYNAYGRKFERDISIVISPGDNDLAAVISSVSRCSLRNISRIDIHHEPATLRRPWLILRRSPLRIPRSNLRVYARNSASFEIVEEL